MKKLNFMILLIILSFSLTFCKNDSDNSFDIIGTKWNKIENGIDKTIVFENNSKAYMIDKVIKDEPVEYMGETYNKGSIIYTYYNYTFNQDTEIGRIEPVIKEYEDMTFLGADFYILKNGKSLLIKNEIIELIFNKI